ncbi:MAG: hypothetical protein WCK90_01150, partial [archaeon]
MDFNLENIDIYEQILPLYSEVDEREVARCASFADNDLAKPGNGKNLEPRIPWNDRDPTLGDFIRKNKSKEVWLGGMFRSKDFLDVRVDSIVLGHIVYEAEGRGWKVSAPENLRLGKTADYLINSEREEIQKKENFRMANSSRLDYGKLAFSGYSRLTPVYLAERNSERVVISHWCIAEATGQEIGGKMEWKTVKVPL